MAFPAHPHSMLQFCNYLDAAWRKMSNISVAVVLSIHSPLPDSFGSSLTPDIYRHAVQHTDKKWIWLAAEAKEIGNLAVKYFCQHDGHDNPDHAPHDNHGIGRVCFSCEGKYDSIAKAYFVICFFSPPKVEILQEIQNEQAGQ